MLWCELKDKSEDEYQLADISLSDLWLKALSSLKRKKTAADLTVSPSSLQSEGLTLQCVFVSANGIHLFIFNSQQTSWKEVLDLRHFLFLDLWWFFP